MDFATIENLIIAAAPALTAIIAIISACISLVKKIKNVACDTKINAEEIKEIKQAILNENAALKRENAALKATITEKIDKIYIEKEI